ncbi:PepSY-associated TM helix domain-containing protein [Aquimarina intermedia]|uniref:Putative iron-regulated membrane protein n=1 Tax=Aquimarina intermedia TaxID=350814 RepID=A0A5S5C054_9FLAO|nr:PepSY domain-containing protein [Aquimarina intermedia]TYP72805.1 putative iron-regulated membrane protein [Aquimarina intermedia]
MKKNKKLNQWLWKWHFIAGLISLPFILILSITGGIYLFKSIYEEPIYKEIKEVIPDGEALSYQEQWKIAKENALTKPSAVVVPTTTTEATEFVSGRFGNATSIFIDPYKGEVSGELLPKNSFMFKIRKLHGELLLGKTGTLLIELVASWMVVLIITGLFIWWPARGWRIKGFFVPRIKSGKQTFYRDLHAITGFWISILLLITLAGGFPWTDVFGNNFKWVQKITHTGFPNDWNGTTIISTRDGLPITLDQMIATAKQEKLPGITKITLPQNKTGVFSVSNTYPLDQSQQIMLHFDQYTGKTLVKKKWDDVGVLMRSRMWVMAFHQGQFGNWNWLLMLFTALFLIVISVAAITHYLVRKRKNIWGVPNVPSSFTAGYWVLGSIIFLSVVFPLFGASILLIATTNYIFRKKKQFTSL